MNTRPFGRTGVQVSTVGYGAMALSLPGCPEESESLRILAAVLDQGVSFLDTADTYCPGPGEAHHNERLLARATAAAPRGGRPVYVATKGGTRRAGERWEVDGAPEHLYRSICASYQALGGTSPVFLWQLHWPDPRYPIPAMLAAARRAMDERLVRFVGVCNFTVEQVRQAEDAVPLVSVQNQFNLWHREAETEGILEYCEQRNLVFLPWRPLGGLGLAHRLGEIRPLARLAHERGSSPQRLMIAWHLAKSKCILPIPGSKRLEHILDCLSAAGDRLEPAEVRLLDGISAAELPRRDRAAAWEGMPPLAEPR